MVVLYFLLPLTRLSIFSSIINHNFTPVLCYNQELSKKTHGIAIVVSEEARATGAYFLVKDPPIVLHQVSCHAFFAMLMSCLYMLHNYFSFSSWGSCLVASATARQESADEIDQVWAWVLRYIQDYCWICLWSLSMLCLLVWCRNCDDLLGWSIQESMSYHGYSHCLLQYIISMM